MPKLGYVWRKSARSSGNGNCVQARRDAASAGVEIGDTKDPGGPTLVVSREAWRAFIAAPPTQS